MSDAEREIALDPWLAALRGDQERAPAAAQERVASRLARAGHLPMALGGAVGAVEVARRSFLHSRGFAVSVALPFGVLLGAVGHAWLAPSPVVLQVAPSVAPVVREPAPAEVQTVPVEQLPAEPLPSAEGARPRPKPVAPTPPLGLDDELLLLERARTQLAEGKPSATLEMLQKHRRAFPSSSLEQEREALAIRALVAAGRHAEARRRADAFVTRFPKSALRAGVERAIESIP